MREEERGEKIQPAKKKRCFTLSKTCFPSVLENKRKQTRVMIEKKKKTENTNGMLGYLLLCYILETMHQQLYTKTNQNEDKCVSR